MEYIDEKRCIECKGKCCQLYYIVLEKYGFDICKQTYNELFYFLETDIEPNFDAKRVFNMDRGLEELIRLKLKGIDIFSCQYRGKYGCRLPREERPKQCLEYRCPDWRNNTGNIPNECPLYRIILDD